jgi:hypothetical protein
MAKSRLGANAISARGTDLLLTLSSGGTAVHLSKKAQPGDESRAALLAHHLRRSDSSPPLDAYDLDQLAGPCWNTTTLCGRNWVGMGAGGGRPDLLAGRSAGVRAHLSPLSGAHGQPLPGAFE